jgi:hypothetical protein
VSAHVRRLEIIGTKAGAVQELQPNHAKQAVQNVPGPFGVGSQLGFCAYPARCCCALGRREGETAGVTLFRVFLPPPQDCTDELISLASSIYFTYVIEAKVVWLSLPVAMMGMRKHQ